MKSPWLAPTLLALLFWGVWPVFVKLVTQLVPYRQAIVLEWVGSTAVTLGVLLSLGGRFSCGGSAVVYGALAGATGMLGALAFAAAIGRTATPSLVVIATALCPAITLVLNRFLLAESLTGRQWAGVILGLVAVVLMASGDSPSSAPGGGSGSLGKGQVAHPGERAIEEREQAQWLGQREPAGALDAAVEVARGHVGAGRHAPGPPHDEIALRRRRKEEVDEPPSARMLPGTAEEDHDDGQGGGA